MKSLSGVQISTPSYRMMLVYWLPALLAGGIIWGIFITIGQTPFVRASGLALVIMGASLTMRRFGAIIAFLGGISLALAPAFWSQTGGATSFVPATVVLAMIIAGIISLVVIFFLKRPYLALGVGVLVFAVIFWSQIGTSRSLRLTSLMTAWLLFLLMEALFQSNPRPDEKPATPIMPQQYMGILIILAIGIINDPLFVLILPAVALGLWLSQTRIPLWYWGIVVALLGLGVYGIINTYINPDLWLSSSRIAHQTKLTIPYLIADGWREGVRWLNLVGMSISQFTIIGAILSVLGLARMARWYPVLGLVLMVAYATHVLFGLIYFGGDRAVLIMPIFIIQMIWLAYAMYSFGEWLSKFHTGLSANSRFIIGGIFLLLPVYLLINLLSNMS
ncbi:MAG: hypothetical protein SH821_04130 [Phototrophicales bacterium]|nr:hypothetical protein [Phototrophicales bacterium]